MSESFLRISDLCPVHVIFNTTDVGWAAGIVADRTYSLNRVHYQRKKKVFDGIEEKKKRGSEQTQFVNRYKDEAEDVPMTPQVHGQDARTQVINLQRLEYLISDANGVRKETLKPVNPWAFARAVGGSFSDSYLKKAAAVVERLRNRLIFQPVQQPPQIRAEQKAPPPPTPAPLPSSNGHARKAVARLHGT